ncbi:PAS domain-containing protein [Lacibacterium aquatile]|uniref:PAS domain-containing protein n=1 Tax=Lacibacterium aquatile TaxID=1168082 RepID=A0ABW5DZA4_9PROT
MPAQKMPHDVQMPQQLLPRGGRLDSSGIRRLASPLDRFYRYWLALPQAVDGVPSRRAFRPEAVRDLLPGVLLLDVEGQGGQSRYRYRLIGTSHRSHMASDFTGRFVDEVQPPERYAVGASNFSAILAARTPGWWRSHNVFRAETQSPYHRYERLLAPFCEPDGRVTLLAGVWHWTEGSEETEWSNVQL